MYNSPKVIQHNLNLSTDEFTNLNSHSNRRHFEALKIYYLSRAMELKIELMNGLAKLVGTR